MIPLVGSVLFEIGFFLFHTDFGNATLSAILMGVFFIVGKRIGVRLTVDYITKRFNLRRKTAHELQTEHHENEIVKLGGQPWGVESQGLGKRTIGLKLPFGLRMKYLAPIVTRFTRQQVTEKSISRRKRQMSFLKSNLSKKLIVATVTILLAALNKKFELGMSDETILVIAALAATYVAGQSHVDAKRESAKPFVLGGPNDTDYSKSDSTSE